MCRFADASWSATTRGSVADLDADALHNLSLTPPDRFVAARNALVKERRAAGDREAAAAIAALRRPTWIDWALATVAAQEPSLVDGFADAADAMRAAQAEAVEGRGGGVPDALRAVRAQVAALAKSVDRTITGSGRGSELAGVTERLTEIANDPAATAASRTGRSTTRTSSDAGSGCGSDSEEPVEPSAIRERSSERADAHAQQRRALVRELADLDREQRAAAHHLARAERTLDEAAAKRDAAAAAAARAAEELERAAARVDEAAIALAALRADADDGAARRARLQRDLDALANHQRG